ncbi:MAG: hypothetical protein GXO75_08225 [Calditrichaeota bacterium]|nr:hypothetical protein [Calditrichota bacterium]
MAGIQETLDVIRFGLAVGNSLGKALQDKKFDVADLLYFVDSLTKLPSALSGFEKVPEELKDMEEAEFEVIKETIAKEFDIPQDNIEPIIEDAIKIAVVILVFLKKHFA